MSTTDRPAAAIPQALADPGKREAGFIIQALATAALMFGALGRVIWILATVGA